MLASLVLVLVIVQTVVSCPFAEKQGSLRAANDKIHRKLLTAEFIPNANLFPACALGPTQTSAANIQSVYKELKTEFNALIDQSDDFTRSNIFGAALRLAFHDAGEVDLHSTDLLGSDGCLSNSESNSGLIEPTTVLMTVFEPLWQKKFCTRISRADFWVLLGKLAAEKADPTHTVRIPYQFGRRDNANCDAGAGRLPEHQPGFPEFDRVFIKRMGLVMYDVVALLGAHTVGHVHPEFSGFGVSEDPQWLKVHFADNAWDETPQQFDHQFFRSLLFDTWQNHINKDRPKFNTWFVSRNEDAHGFESPEHSHSHTQSTTTAGASLATVGTHAAKKRDPLHIKTMKLNADMVLAFPIHTDPNPANGALTGVDGELCSAVALGPNAPVAMTCSSSKYGVVNGTSPTYAQVKAYSENNALFLRDFADAYVKMTTVGFSIDGESARPAKMGSLQSIDLGDYWAK